MDFNSRGKGNYLFDYYNRGVDDEYPDWGSTIHTWRSNPLLSKVILMRLKRLLQGRCIYRSTSVSGQPLKIKYIKD